VPSAGGIGVLFVGALVLLGLRRKKES